MLSSFLQTFHSSPFKFVHNFFFLYLSSNFSSIFQSIYELSKGSTPFYQTFFICWFI
uniref:Uncharacterized protein n=1 Tax=Arundo donax TaxID=35708 RepID=A0A0A9CIL3_ARUDO